MSKAETKTKPKRSLSPAERHEQIRVEGGRETVESIVVAIILALLFRAFVAEAFVIPTGSMAPTLMGAHKDVTCQECGQPYQTGASIEERATPQEVAVVASICPNCRYLNPIDLAGRSNDATFAGDRILVSKFAYALSDPERWDVIVFKYPGNPKQNYIKRLVGLPEETLRIRYGDVYARPHGTDEFEILRKPPAKTLAMAQLVHDTQYQAAALVAADYPSNWQPWEPAATEPPTDSWQISRDADTWQASLPEGSSTMRTLRYYHRWPGGEQWQQAEQGLSLAAVDPYSSRTITDFYAYNSYITVDADAIYDLLPGRGFLSSSGALRENYQPGIEGLSGRVTFGMGDGGREGRHWVGDLIVEADLETHGTEGEVRLELVESAVLYHCYIDLATGKARLEIVTEKGPVSFADAGGSAKTTPTADTAVRIGGRHQLRLANCDDQLVLWVDGSPVAFDAPTSFDTSAIRPLDQQRPYRIDEHPYDAAPVAVSVKGAGATLHRLQVLRDKYYIAIDGRTNRGALIDYDLAQMRVSDRFADIQMMLTDPANWDDLTLWEARRTVEFDLDEDQFFPMGDNSPESADARCWITDDGPYGSRNGAGPADAYLWADASYVPRDLLVGKALMVFWPHTWNAPVPFTPNLRRVGFIR